MKKKMLTVAVLAAMTLTTASVFASPVITGDARVDYFKDSGADKQITNRIRLNVDSNIGDSLYVHGRVNLDNNMETGISNVSTDQIYIGGDIGSVNFKVGKQSLFVGKGLLADTGGLDGLNLVNSGKNAKINVFAGKITGKSVTAANMSTTVGQANLGASYLKNDSEKYFGINTDTKISSNGVLNLEYVKNQDSSAKGYLAEVVFGNATKKGNVDYALSYRNIEDGAVSGYSTDSNYNDSKGLKFKAHYKVTDNATVGIYHDMAKKQDGTDKQRTEVEFGVNF